MAGAGVARAGQGPGVRQSDSGDTDQRRRGDVIWSPSWAAKSYVSSTKCAAQHSQHTIYYTPTLTNTPEQITHELHKEK